MCATCQHLIAATDKAKTYGIVIPCYMASKSWRANNSLSLLNVSDSPGSQSLAPQKIAFPDKQATPIFELINLHWHALFDEQPQYTVYPTLGVNESKMA